MTKIEFWTYEGQLWCCSCTNKRFGDDALRAQTAIDSEGNRPHPVTWTELFWEPEDEGDVRCASCDAIITTVQHFQ